MIKTFYVSGFLYHPTSEQIVLQQENILNNPLSLWKMFGDFNRDGENPQSTFQRIILEELHIKLPLLNVLPVYEHDYNKRKTMHYVFYAEVKKLHTFPVSDTKTYSWFTFRQTTKMHFTDQSKQDIIISERVIDALERSKNPVPVVHPTQHANLFR